MGKLICEQVIPFSKIPKELWLQFEDKDSYMAREKELDVYKRQVFLGVLLPRGNISFLRDFALFVESLIPSF